MTPAQQAALRRAVKADGPVKIGAATAAVLCEHYQYIEAALGGWIATAKGCAVLAREDHDRRYRERRAAIPKESKAHAERLVAWLSVHGYLGGMERYGENYVVKNYAEHYAACIHAGLEPVRPEGSTDWIEHDMEMAAACLADYDAVSAKATARGVAVEIDYGVAKSHPKPKSEAATTRADGTVDLRAYRLARPEKPNGAA